ncbi:MULTISPECIES: hypothetical protein [Priestia]|uniref:Uncharacterized protein n=1 Tax=Priestia aryabhattai TaxID=412384 RepID=A0AAX6N2T0_PRIAR|nr:hypothetical protein [Priestia aryabhattai]MDU9690172.1 hypothetical protein [Priestia aryabhattai]
MESKVFSMFKRVLVVASLLLVFTSVFNFKTIGTQAAENVDSQNLTDEELDQELALIDEEASNGELEFLDAEDMDKNEVYTEDDLATLEEGLSLIESLPDELATEDTTVERLDWMIDNTEDSELQSALVAEKEKITNTVPVIAAFSAGKCARGIATAIAQNAVPIAKILKIKKAVKVAGGTARFANKLVQSYDYYSRIKKPGSRVAKYSKTTAMKLALKKTAKATPDAFDALYALLGIDSFINGCLK